MMSIFPTPSTVLYIDLIKGRYADCDGYLTFPQLRLMSPGMDPPANPNWRDEVLKLGFQFRKRGLQARKERNLPFLKILWMGRSLQRQLASRESIEFNPD